MKISLDEAEKVLRWKAKNENEIETLYTNMCDEGEDKDEFILMMYQYTHKMIRI